MKRKGRGEEQATTTAATTKRGKKHDGEDEGKGKSADGGKDGGKLRFSFKQTTPLNKSFSFKSKPTTKKSKKSPAPAPSPAPAAIKPVQVEHDPSVFDNTCPFFAGCGLDDLASSFKSNDAWGEWEWDESEEATPFGDGEWCNTSTNKNDSLITAFNAVCLRRWVEEVEVQQEPLFVDELRRRTEQEREREREKERERERLEKEKEGLDTKKKPAAKTTAAGKRKATAAAAATPVTGKGKGAKAAKAGKPAKKGKAAKGKAGLKKEDAGAAQTADGLKKERDDESERDREDENGVRDIDESYLTLWERLRLDRIRTRNDNPAFARYAPYPIDRLMDVKVSLTVNLYPNGFSLGGSTLGEQQSVSYPYDSSTKDFIKTIDSLRLPPDFVELLDEVPCVYYDGCLVVEVRDFRGTNNPAGLAGPPVVRRVLLQPDTETIVSDVEQICADHADWTTDDCLKIEQSLVLATAPPLCLDPDVKVGLAANVLNYNKCKYNLTRTAKKRLLASTEPLGGKDALPKKGGISFALMDFLSKKNYRPPQNAFESDTLPINRKPLKDVDKTKKVSLPALLLSHVRNIKKIPYQPKRVQFHARDGRSYCHLELRLNPCVNGFEAAIIEGVSGDTTQEHPTPYPVGNTEEAEQFFTQIKTLYLKEGKLCNFDSTGMARSATQQMPNLKVAPQASAGMRGGPIPQQQQQQQAAYMSLMRRGAAPAGGRPMTPSQHALYQQAIQAGANPNHIRAAAAAAQAASGQSQPGFERSYMSMVAPGGYVTQMSANTGQAGGMPVQSGIPGQSNGPLTPGQMGGLPMSPQGPNIPHGAGQAQGGAPMSGPLTPGGSQAVPPGSQMGPGGQVPPPMGQGPVPGMGGMVGTMGGGAQMGGGPQMGAGMGGMSMYPQSGGMPPGAPPGGAGMTPMMATYRRGSGGGAPMRGQAMRGRAMPPSAGPMSQGQPGMVGMPSSGVPSPSTMGPPSSPSLTAPSTPTMGGPMTPTSMASMSSQAPMGMAPTMGMQPAGMPMSPMSPMSPTGMMPNPGMGMGMQPLPTAGMPQGMGQGMTAVAAAARAQHPQERKFLLENMQQRNK